MKLKAKLESLDGLNEAFHEFYQEKDGVFYLQVDDIESTDNTGELRRAKEREKEARKTAEKQASDLQAKLDELQQKMKDEQDNKNREAGDVEALEKSWSEKLSNREKELTGQIDALTGNLKTLLVDNVAGRMAAELALEGSADVLVPHIQRRLSAEERDGKMVTVVKDLEGKPSATTLDELRQEFSDNPVFAPIIVGSKATGGGANQDETGGGASKNSDLSRANAKSLVAHIDSKN